MNPETTPTLATDPALLGVLNGLISREPIFHRPEWSTTRLQSDRRPVGRRGLSLSRAGQRYYPLTYTLLQQSERKTRRSTIWQRTPDGWKIVFHQGTIVQDS
jgi:hypothetical protein